MINENFWHPSTRLPLDGGGDVPQPEPNPKAHLLEVGDIVRRNYSDAQTRHDRQPGRILKIENGRAEVRWQNLGTEWIRLQLLVKDTD
jgi:hypothetical protein